MSKKRKRPVGKWPKGATFAYRIYRRRDRDWGVMVKSRNGKQTLTAGEGYRNRIDAERSLLAFMDAVANGKVGALT